MTREAMRRMYRDLSVDPVIDRTALLTLVIDAFSLVWLVRERPLYLVLPARLAPFAYRGPR